MVVGSEKKVPSVASTLKLINLQGLPKTYLVATFSMSTQILYQQKHPTKTCHFSWCEVNHISIKILKSIPKSAAKTWKDCQATHPLGISQGSRLITVRRSFNKITRSVKAAGEKAGPAKLRGRGDLWSRFFWKNGGEQVRVSPWVVDGIRCIYIYIHYTTYIIYSHNMNIYIYILIYSLTLKDNMSWITLQCKKIDMQA